MFIEQRRYGTRIKYYLVHSYREYHQVKKIRKYLGKDLSQGELAVAKAKAKAHILALLEQLSTSVFMFKLTKAEIISLNRYNNQIRIHHLNKRAWKRFTEEFVYNTNAIEGSSVSLHEVRALLGARKPANDEELEARGVAKAITFIKTTSNDLSLELIRKLHRYCFKETKGFAGQFRNVDVVIRDAKGDIIHRGVEKAKLRKSLNELISWYKRSKARFKPLVLAAIIHNQFEHIHPFQDGNGRVGRLLLNYVLLQYHYPPINIALEDRKEYYASLQQYSQHGKLRPTLQFLIKQYKKTMVTTKKVKG